MRIMKILGIDSSGLVASAAIADEKNIIAEFTVNNKQTHSQTLLPMIEKVVDMSGIELEQIDASRRIYSVRRLIGAWLKEDWMHKVLFTGEFFWHMSTRYDLKKELKNLPKENMIEKVNKNAMEVLHNA